MRDKSEPVKFLSKLSRFISRDANYLPGHVYITPTISTVARFEDVCEKHDISVGEIVTNWMENVSDEELLKVVERISRTL